MKEYTEKDFAIEVGLSKQTISNWRHGYKKEVQLKEEVKIYMYPAIFEKGVDWFWREGRIIIREIAKKKLEGRKNWEYCKCDLEQIKTK